MVGICEIPITGKHKDKFLSFFSKHGDYHKLEHSEYTTIKQMQFLSYLHLENPYSTCAICGTGIKYIYVYKNKDTKKKYGLGCCCAANIEALKESNGMDALNFARLVDLQKKTLLKRANEYRKEQEKILNEVKYHTEFTYVKTFLDKVEELMPDLADRFPSLYDHSVRRFHDWFYWFNQGKISEYYTNELRKNMAISIEKRIARLKEDYDYCIEEQKKKDAEFEYAKILYEIPTLDMNYYDKKTKDSLLDWYRDREFYTPKQKALIEKLGKRYEKKRRKFE